MKLVSETPTTKLRPLVIYCCPEVGQFFPVENTDFPANFAPAEIAVSKSAQDRGWVRKLSFSFKTWVGADSEKLLLRLNTYDLILVYPLSLNTLAKFALGIQDSFPTSILFEAAALGKPILLNDQFIPSLESHMNPHLIRIYRQHWERILSGTVASFNFSNLEEITAKIIRQKQINAQLPPESNRQFITRDDVIVASESLEPLKISASAIVTDLAREEADARGVIIIRE
jgi:phosphopantothenoylcysteine synthetase/decarboxylase